LSRAIKNQNFAIGHSPLSALNSNIINIFPARSSSKNIMIILSLELKNKIRYTAARENILKRHKSVEPNLNLNLGLHSVRSGGALFSEFPGQL
jgi:hypothetical protein